MEKNNHNDVVRRISKDIICELIIERKKQGITQQKIAERTGMKTSNVTRIESCKNIPTMDVLIRYAQALGKSIHIELKEEER